MIEVKVGQHIHLLSRRLRTDGLTDTQEVIGRVTLVDDYYAEYEVIEHVREENKLHTINKGGFSRTLTPEQLLKFTSITILESKG